MLIADLRNGAEQIAFAAANNREHLRQQLKRLLQLGYQATLVRMIQEGRSAHSENVNDSLRRSLLRRPLWHLHCNIEPACEPGAERGTR